MQRLPGRDEELCTDEEGGAAALLGADRPRRWRVGAGLVTAAALGLAGLALATAPWHRGAATVGGAKLSHSLNSHPEDRGTPLTQAMAKGDSHIYVQSTDVFVVGDGIVIVDTRDGGSLNIEEAVVKGVEDGKVILVDPVSQSLPANCYVMVPADPASQTGSHYHPDQPVGPMTVITSSHTGSSPPPHHVDGGGGDNTAFKVLVGFLLISLLGLILFLCIFLVSKYWGATTGAPKKEGYWMFKPTDGRAVIALEAPSLYSQETVHVVNPGERITVIEKQPLMTVERFANAGGVVETQEAELGEGNSLFLKLADGKGWLVDREPGNDMCYELFTEVDQVWLYNPTKSGGQMPILKVPDTQGERTGKRLQPGDKFKVSEIQAFSDNGILFLRLADGGGWVYDQHVDDGELLCKRMVEETWVYRPANGAPMMVRKSPGIHGEKTTHKVFPDTRFEVDEVVIGDRDRSLLFLKLSDGRGWLFNKHPEVGALCDRVY